VHRTAALRPTCPVTAIFAEDDVLTARKAFTEIDRTLVHRTKTRPVPGIRDPPPPDSPRPRQPDEASAIFGSRLFTVSNIKMPSKPRLRETLAAALS
jgi:hypothetical protein